MYKLIEYRKSKGTVKADYEFKDFKAFEQMVGSLLLPLTGKYTLNIITDDVGEVQKFIKNESLYKHLIINVYTTSSVLEYISMRDTTAVFAEKEKDFDIFKELIMEKKVYFEKKALFKLYNSIEHKYDEMEKALDLLLNEYGRFTQITESMLSRLFVVNDMVYPRQVLIEYLWLRRYREYKLAKCLAQVGNDVTVGAFIKNVKTFIKEKETYIKTGQGSNLVKSINTDRLCLMYRIFVLDKNGISDASILLKLYERGLTPYDFIYRE